ncbi:MAG: phage holin, LLH family [Acutalibacteraceae bacterium]
MNDYTNIIEIIISLLSAVITAFLIPVLKQRLSAEKTEKLKFWVKTAVSAAEQIYGGKSGNEKKKYVVNFLLSKGIVFDVDEVSALIESEVYKLTGCQS